MTARVALVGYGLGGRTFHAPPLAEAGAPPAVVVTRSPERAAQARADLPGAEVVPDLGAALAAGCDLVVVTSPTGLHAEHALACVAAGVPVVVDKPLGVDAAQADSVVAAASAAGVPLTVFQNRRWDPEQRTLRRLLREGGLGEVHRFERRWERWRPVPKDRWREAAPAAEGGGIVLDLQSHLVDAAVQLFGPVAAVYAEVAARTTPADDDAFLALTHAGGVRSHLAAASLVGAPGPRTRVLGSRGAYVVGTFEADMQAFTGFEDAPGGCGWLVTGAERRPVPEEPGGHADLYRAVLAALALPTPAERQAAMPVDPRDAVHVLRVLDAARVSAATGQVVPVDGHTRTPGAG